MANKDRRSPISLIIADVIVVALAIWVGILAFGSDDAQRRLPHPPPPTHRRQRRPPTPTSAPTTTTPEAAGPEPVEVEV